MVGELEIRADQFQAFVAGHSLDLTRREFELLSMLAEAAGKVLEREEIYQRVWGYAMAHGDRSVDVFIRKLRLKLEKQSPGLGLHPHPLRRRLPVRARGSDPSVRRPRRTPKRRNRRRRSPSRLTRPDPRKNRLAQAATAPGSPRLAVHIVFTTRATRA